jgi:hypothetical protein
MTPISFRARCHRMGFNLVLLICAVVLGAGCVARHGGMSTPSGPARELVGAWRLVSWEARADGQVRHPFGAEARGILIYTSSGRMSVFLSQTNRPPFAQADAKAGTLEEKAAAFDSCFAYAGTFHAVAGRVIHRLEHCTFPNWAGSEQLRLLQLSGDRLVLETPPLPMDGRAAVSRLTWERIRH